MLRSSCLTFAPVLLLCAGISACSVAPDQGVGGDDSESPSAARGASTMKETALSALDDLDEEDLAPSEEGPSRLVSPRGFGTMTGRLPGTNTTVSGVRLRGHSVRVTIRDGFAHTEIEEEFANDSDRVLEGRYIFPMPPDSSLSRLALWVNEELVEGEMVERDRAARIFQGIVDDIVRPRDPALLEWTRGSSFSLKIFPMPARGSRRVLLAYDEVLPVVKGRARYVYPLSLGEDRAVTMDSFRLHVTVDDAGATAAEAKVLGHPATLRTDNGRLEADFQAESFVPKGDFVLDYPRPETDALPVALEGSSFTTENPGFFAVRVPVEATLSAGVMGRDERVVVIDKSHGMTRQGLDAEIAVADAIVRRLGDRDRFAVLLCDSACSSYPIRGLASASADSLEEARQFIRAASPSGASDLGGAMMDAIQRLDQKGRGQIVFLSDGAPSAGELKVDTISARIAPKLRDKGAELRLFGAGPSVDEMVLEGLSSSLSASYERLATGESLPRRAADIAKGLSAPLLTNIKIELPKGFLDVYPRHLPAVRLGEEIVVVGRVAGATGGSNETLTMSGMVQGEPMEISHALALGGSPSADRGVLARRWATARISELGRISDEAAAKETIALSLRYHVQSRLTSLLVLENDRMFAAFGIPRTQGSGKLSAAAETGNSNGLSGLRGDPLGDAFGSSGLGLSGVGQGAGGRGEGIGIGSGFGSGHGRLGTVGHNEGRSFVARAPRVRMGSTTVSGRMPPEVIQRIVRQNFGRFRLCYENGLRKTPGLSGRVGVRFIITRDGSVSSVVNGGSDMPDSGVISCVLRAFYGLSFPQPEGGVVTVVYPIVFSSEDGAPGPARVLSGSPLRSTGFAEGNGSWIGKADESWRKDSADGLSRLLKDVNTSPESRRARESLVSGLLAKGHFEEALREARQYVALDPDRVRAQDLLAQSAAALGDEALAISTLDSELELEPVNADLHRRAARAFEAAGDERRACAHFRALAEIRPNDADVLAESLRCQAFVDGERESVRVAIDALTKPGKRILALREALEKNEVLPYSFGEPGGERIWVKVTCGEGVEGCPRVVLLDPQGRVATPILPGNGRSGASWVGASWASSGNYRVLVTGGLPETRGEVSVRLDDMMKKFPVQGGEGARSVAIIAVGG